MRTMLLVLLVSVGMGRPLCSEEKQDIPLPPVPGKIVSALTPAPGRFTEPAVAVNPRNPRQVVAAFQDNAQIAYSSDGGRSWSLAEGIAPKDYKVSGDVSVTFDSRGRAILCYIAFDKLGTFNYWGHGASRNGIFIRLSLDGGKTWEARQIPVAQQASVPGVPFEDKPYIVADIGSGKNAGNLYVGWTRWTQTASLLLLSRSTDGGKTWSAPVELDDRPGLPRDDNGSLEGFAGAVGPDGTLHAVWSGPEGIMHTFSRDGGKRFSRAQVILQTAPSMFAIQGVTRANGFPQIAIDPHGGGRRGKMYVTWSDYRNGDLDVFCSSSRDGGRKWSDPARVNNDALHDGADQYFQWLAVDAVDGSVNAVFYDRRDDPKNQKQIVVLARSQDGGKSFRNYAWTSEAFDPGGVFLGDYNGIAAFNGRVYGVWTDRPAHKKTDAEEARTQGQTPRDTTIQAGGGGF